jgi:hypothetical protein
VSTKIDFRLRGRRYLDAAHRLPESGDSASLRYACLELRMCIEALAYDRLQAYLPEVPNSVMKKWTPRHVLAVQPLERSGWRAWGWRLDKGG